MNSVKVIVLNEPWTDMVEIAIVAGGAKPYVMRIGEDAKPTWEEFEEFTNPGPTLRLRTDVWNELCRVAGQHTQVNDATVEALRDTRVVRDRLLTLIEKREPGSAA